MKSEIIPENEHPINQIAKKLLLSTKDGFSEPYELYILQLLRWGLYTGQTGIEPTTFEEMELEPLLASWPPSDVLQLLTSEPDAPLRIADLDVDEPSAAVARLLEALRQTDLYEN